MKSTIRLALVASMTFAISCGGNATETATATTTTFDPTAPRCEVGQGEVEWEDMSADGLAMVVHGPQGGWHILGSVRTWNMTDIQELTFQIIDDTSGISVSDVEAKVLVPDGEDCDGCSEHIGMYGYLDTDKLGQGLTCEYCVDEDTGKVDPECIPPELLINASMTACFTVLDDADNAASCCVSIIGEPDPQDLDCIPE